VPANATPLEILPEGKYRAVLGDGATLDFGSMTQDPVSGNVTFFARQAPPVGLTYNPYYFIGFGAYWPLPEILPATPVDPANLTMHPSAVSTFERIRSPIVPICNAVTVDPIGDDGVVYPPGRIGFIEGAGNGS
jgi:hypothetical protein